MARTFAALVVSFLFPASLSADVVRAATIRVAGLYLSPDASSTKLADIDRGRGVIYLETSGDWIHVEANLTEEKTVTGWTPSKGLIQANTSDSANIHFGEALDAQDQA